MEISVRGSLKQELEDLGMLLNQSAHNTRREYSDATQAVFNVFKPIAQHIEPDIDLTELESNKVQVPQTAEAFFKSFLENLSKFDSPKFNQFWNIDHLKIVFQSTQSLQPQVYFAFDDPLASLASNIQYFCNFQELFSLMAEMIDKNPKKYAFARTQFEQLFGEVKNAIKQPSISKQVQQIATPEFKGAMQQAIIYLTSKSKEFEHDFDKKSAIDTLIKQLKSPDIDSNKLRHYERFINQADKKINEPSIGSVLDKLLTGIKHFFSTGEVKFDLFSPNVELDTVREAFIGPKP
jgi:hypothetical protein